MKVTKTCSDLFRQETYLNIYQCNSFESWGSLEDDLAGGIGNDVAKTQGTKGFFCWSPVLFSKSSHQMIRLLETAA